MVFHLTLLKFSIVPVLWYIAEVLKYITSHMPETCTITEYKLLFLIFYENEEFKFMNDALPIALLKRRLVVLSKKH